MMKWTRQPFYPTEAMEHSIVQWNMRGFQANVEEHALLSRRYRPAVFGLREHFNQFQITIIFWFYYINQKFTKWLNNVRVMLNKVVTFCTSPSDHTAKMDLIKLIEQLPSLFVLLSDFSGHSPVWGPSPITPEDKCWRTSSPKWIDVF